jgi:hypothetical protein
LFLYSREKEQKVSQFYFSTFGKGGAKRLALKLSKQVIWQYSNKNKHLD